MYDHKKVEQKIQDYWETNKIFEKSLENRKKAKSFVFFEGPPTANGLPGIHHVEARAFKDIICRFKTMRGFYVLRKAGWDTHGLPVELEVEKQLGFKNKKDIEKYGIAEFNKKAKESVWKYKKEWEELTKKIGFWIDMNQPYITYENYYIESLWAIIKKIWDKKLLYLAHKVAPFCTRCGTSLSFHEVAQGYKTITDLSLIVKLKIKNLKFKVDGGPIYILAWTTTPWTLPGNVALAVGRTIKYQVVSIKGKDEKYILAEDLAGKVLNTEYILHDTILGSDLIGLEYEPLFDIKELKSETSYKVYEADFVSTQEGTGIVHIAPMYGEDDYVLGTKFNLHKFHTVDQQGKFTHVSSELDGKYVKSKETEDLIIQKLKIGNRLLKIEPFEHEYPFCWRCFTPLLYYAKESWFIKMSALNKTMVDNNRKINWIPEHIKEGRFGQWLKEGKDWTFSRERYWGTPLPIWQCLECGNHQVVGSLDDLEKNRATLKNKFFILRHGHNSHSASKSHDLLISTRIEHDKHYLSDVGIKQSKELAAQSKKIGINAIYTSPFIRTKQTAQIIGDELELPYFVDERLKELDHGSMCENKTEYVCIPPDFKKDFDTKYGDGESWRIGRTRMMNFIKEIDEKHKDGKILIVSHRSPLWLMESALLGMNDEESMVKREGLYLKEGELREVDFKNYPYDAQGGLDLHRPYIDQIRLKCEKCGSEMKKLPDLVDVWFDSGAMPFAQWHKPFENEKIFKEQFPADYIVEGMDQTRGWFYTLLAVSSLLDMGAPYKNVISLGLLLDEKGQKMSKSKGNIVSPFDVIEQFGADVIRWYFYTVNAPGDYKLFTKKDVELRLKGFLFTLNNCLRFYELYKSGRDKGQETRDKEELDLLDEWILSKLNRLILNVTENLDKYDITFSARAIETFVVEDFSNWWLRRSRKKKEALGMLKFVLTELSKLLAPFTPFIAEEIYIHVDHLGGHANSVHLQDWPVVNKKFINDGLETEMEEVRDIVTAGLAVRKKDQKNVRQPFASVAIRRKDKFDSGLEELIRQELNIKKVKYHTEQKELIVYDMELSQALKDERIINEFKRKLQDLYKEQDLDVSEEKKIIYETDNQDIKRSIENHKANIFKTTSTTVTAGLIDVSQTKAVEVIEVVPGKKVKIGLLKNR